MSIRYSECPRCRQKRLVVRVTEEKDSLLKIRTHYVPEGAIGTRSENPICPGSGKRVPPSSCTPL